MCDFKRNFVEFPFHVQESQGLIALGSSVVVLSPVGNYVISGLFCSQKYRKVVDTVVCEPSF